MDSRQIELKRFAEGESAQAFWETFSALTDRIMFLSTREVTKAFHIAAILEDRAVGMVGLQRNPNDASGKEVWIKFVSIDPDSRHQGIAKAMLEEAVNWALESGDQLKPSSYTDENKLYLSRMIEELRASHPAAFLAVPQSNNFTL